MMRLAPESRSKRMGAPSRVPATTGMPCPSLRMGIVDARSPHTDPAVPSFRQSEPQDEANRAAANTAPVWIWLNMRSQWYQRLFRLQENLRSSDQHLTV